MPPPPIARQEEGVAADGDGDPNLATIYADDAALLERLLPRKELRRSHDVVRLSSGRVDERSLAFEAPWFGSGAAATESGAEDGEMEEEGRASDSGPDEEDEEASDGDGSAESDAQAAVPAGDEGGGGGGDGSDDDDVEAEDHEHVNTDRVDKDGNEDAEGEGEALGTTRSSSARKRKLPPSSSTPHVDPARPNKKKVAFAIATAAKTLPHRPSSSKGRSAVRQTAASTKAISAAASSTVTAADKKQKRNMTTPDLATAPASKKNNSATKAKIGLGSSSTPARAPAAQGTARRTGSTKPAANAPSTAQKRKNQAAGDSEEGAYDFSKFF